MKIKAVTGKLKKCIYVIIIGIISNCQVLKSQTIIDDSTEVFGTWSQENSPYLINGVAIVPENETLIIEAGAEILFKAGTDYQYTSAGFNAGMMYVNGKLSVIGTVDEPVLIHSQEDGKNWGCIVINNSSDTSLFNHCKIFDANSITDPPWFKNYEGALYIWQSNVKIYNTEIYQNDAHGIEAWWSYIEMNNTRLGINDGNGLYSWYSTLFSYNSIIDKNQGDGIFLNHPTSDTSLIINNTIVGNDNEGVNIQSDAILNIINTIFWDNHKTIYNNSSWRMVKTKYCLIPETELPEEMVDGTGMIYSVDPQFININSDNYRLKPMSSCIDAGDPATDFSNEPAPNGGKINIGAYGNTSEAAITESWIRITRLSKSNGVMSGKDTITIVGDEFLNSRGDGYIQFGDEYVTTYLHWDDDHIVFVTPPDIPGYTDIKLVNDDEKTALIENGFNYNTPIIEKVSTSYLPLAGNMEITITGNNFGWTEDHMNLFFNNNEATNYYLWKNDTITFICPAGEIGPVDLCFKVNHAISDTLSGWFYYLPSDVREVCGTVEGTWESGKTYKVNCNLTVPGGDTLTIEDGVTILFDATGSKLGLEILGTLIVKGTKNNIVKFTSVPEISGNWSGLFGKGDITVNYASIENGEYGIKQWYDSLKISNSVISNSQIHGIFIVNYEYNAHSIIDNVRFVNNGKGLLCRAVAEDTDGWCNHIISGCEFAYNKNGGIEVEATGSIGGSGWHPATTYASLNIELLNCSVHDNSEYGIYIKTTGFLQDATPLDFRRYGSISAKLNNLLIYNNETGMAVWQNPEYSTTIADTRNATIYGNENGVEMFSGSLYLKNSILWDNNNFDIEVDEYDSLLVVYSDIQDPGSISGEGNISVNPEFINPDNADFTLREESSCIDSGKNEYVESEIDFNLNPRIFDGNGDDEEIVDIGAFEYGSYCCQIIEDINICEGENYHDWTETGQYSRVLASVTGCDSLVVTNLSVISRPEQPVISNVADTLISNASTGNQWYLNDEELPGENNRKYLPVQNGDYFVIVTNQGCSSSPSNSINIIVTSISSQIIYKPRIYPIPSSDLITIEGLPVNEKTEISIYNLNGTLVKEKIVHSVVAHIDLSDLFSGFYYLTINNQGIQLIIKE